MISGRVHEPPLWPGAQGAVLAHGALWPAATAIVGGIVYGVFLSDVWRIGLLAAGLLIVAGWLGASALLQMFVVTSGITLAFVTGNQRSLGGELGGFNLDGLRLLASIAAFTVVMLRLPALTRCWRELWPYLVLLLWGLITLAWSPAPTDGVRFILKLLYPTLGFALSYWVAQRSEQSVLWPLFASGAVLASIANFLIALQTGVWSEAGFEGRYRGGVGYNVVGHFSAMLGLTMAGAWIYTRRNTYLIVGLVMAAQMIATGSRTAFLSFGVGLAVLGVARGRWKATLAALAVGAVVWLVVPTLGLRTVGFEDDQSARVASDWASSVNLSGRTLIWYDVWNSMIANRPFDGSGFGATAPFLAGRFATIRHVHNEYIHILAEGGLIALGLFVAAFALITKRLIQSSAAGWAAGVWSCTALAMFACFLVASVTENTLEIFASYHFYPWCLAGIALGAAMREGPNGSLDLKG